MRRMVESLGYATDGIRYAAFTQLHIRIQASILLGSVLVAMVAKLPWWTWTLLAYVWGGVMVVELVNTALEDLSEGFWGLLYHPRAKFVKDMAAGAVLLTACLALLVTLSIFGYYRVHLLALSPMGIVGLGIGFVAIFGLARLAGRRKFRKPRNGAAPGKPGAPSGMNSQGVSSREASTAPSVNVGS